MLPLYISLLLTCLPSALVLNTTVYTEYGPVWSDLVLSTKQGNEYLAFRGIPYAAPPVGPLRFRPPHKHTQWHEARNATTLAPACYQIVGPKGVDKYGVYLPFDISEDCLYVNVYTPDVQPKKLLPVLVYVHGGAFQYGSGNGFGAQNFMDSSPIVFVSFNYRLGVFGFLSSGDEIVSGNYGLKDQLTLLKWVQANIKRFGGDPKSVTLMGQSSGAHNVHIHTLSTASEGLFHRAVLLSGNALGTWAYYPPQSHEAEHTFSLILEKTECRKSNLLTEHARSKKTIKEAGVECLRKLSPHDLKQAEQSFMANGSISFVFRPVIESKKIPDAFLINDPRELNYPNPKMSIWIGLVSAEGLIFAYNLLKAHPNVNEYSTVLNDDLPFSMQYKYWLKPNEIPRFTERLKSFYFKDTSYITKNDFSSLNELFGKIRFQMPVVDMIVSYPGRVFVYNYDHLNKASPYHMMANNFDMLKSLGNFSGALHSDDLISIFGPEEANMLPLPPVDQKISDKMVIYLKNFVTTGNPNGKTAVQPRWNAVQSRKVEYLYITDKFQMKSGLSEDSNYTFYRSLPIPWREIPNVLPH